MPAPSSAGDAAHRHGLEALAVGDRRARPAAICSRVWRGRRVPARVRAQIGRMRRSALTFVQCTARWSYDVRRDVQRTTSHDRRPRRGLGKRYGDLVGAARRRPRRRPRARVLGLLGHNGAGKTTADPHPHHARAADDGPRARSPGYDVVTRRGAGARAHRPRRPERHRRRPADRPREPRAGRPPLPPAARDVRRARRRAARALRPRRRRPTGSCKDVLRRHAAPARPRREPGRRSRRSSSSTSRPPASIPQRGNELGTSLRELVAERHDARC